MQRMTTPPCPPPPLAALTPAALLLGAVVKSLPSRDWRGYSYAYLLRPLHRRTITSVGGATAAVSGSLNVVELIGADRGGVGNAGGIAGSVGASGPGSVVGNGILDHSDGEGGGVVGPGGDGTSGRDADEPEATYRAGILDDPALTLGKHRHMTRGDQTTGPVVSAPLLCSVVLCCVPVVLKI